MKIPLKLIKGAYTVYQQLGDDADLEDIKHALYTAFGTDPFITRKKFVRRLLKPSETVDIYLANLRRLAVPFGGATDRILECRFLARLPDDISWLLRVSSRPDKLGIDELLARARNILKDTETPSKRQHAASDSAVPRPLESPRCYRCGGLNHYSRDCQSQDNIGGANDQKIQERLHCHHCDRLGHIA